MSLNVSLVVVLAVGLIVWGLVRALQYFFASVYFSVLDILRGFDLPGPAVLVRTVIPVGVGCAIGLLGPEEAYTVASAGCVLGALLLVWGALSSDYHMPSELQTKTLSVRLVLLMFIISYGFLGQLGVLLSEMIHSPLISSWFAQGIIGNLATHLLLIAFSQFTIRKGIRRLANEMESVHSKRQEPSKGVLDLDRDGIGLGK